MSCDRGAPPRKFRFTIRQLMIATGCFALGLLWMPALPMLVWLGLFIGPQADRRRNLGPVLILAAAFYLPAALCIVASEQSRWHPYLAWDQVANDYLRLAPCLPGFLSAVPISTALQVNLTHPVCQLAIGATTLLVLSLFTWLARIRPAMLVALAVLALCYSTVLSTAVPAGMRM